MKFKLKEAEPILREMMEADMISDYEWGEILVGIGAEIDPKDKMIYICPHCDKPRAKCTSEIEKVIKLIVL